MRMVVPARTTDAAAPERRAPRACGCHALPAHARVCSGAAAGRMGAREDGAAAGHLAGHKAAQASCVPSASPANPPPLAHQRPDCPRVRARAGALAGEARFQKGHAERRALA